MEAQYWSSTNQPGTLASALSHIPEIVWNDSCANPVFAQAYGSGDPIAFCNTATLGTAPNSVANPFLMISGGGGGLSSCTTTDNSGNCIGGYAQPSWQSAGYGIGDFGARALPDVSMIATRWLMCSYDTTPCDPTSNLLHSAGGYWNHKSTRRHIRVLRWRLRWRDNRDARSIADHPDAERSGRQGLVNTLLYQLASPEYQNPAIESECDASKGPITSSQCVFYDITSGSNAQPCNVAKYSAADAAGTRPESMW